MSRILKPLLLGRDFTATHRNGDKEKSSRSLIIFSFAFAARTASSSRALIPLSLTRPINSLSLCSFAYPS